MRATLAVLGAATFFISHVAQAGVVFQDSFKSATVFTSKWTVNAPVGKGGTATVQNGDLTLATPGGSDGYMGKADAIIVSPKLPSLDLTQKTIKFNLQELQRQQVGGYKDNVHFYFDLVKGDSVFTVRLHGNYSGYTPDDPDCGWPCYNTYNKHTLWIAEFTPSGENRILKVDLDNSQYYNYFFRITVADNKIVVGYRTEEQADYTEQVAKVSGYNLPTAVNLGVSTGDGGYTRKNAAGKFAVDSFVVYSNAGIGGVAESLDVSSTTCLNTTTNQSVTITPTKANPNWRCKGLKAKPGEKISVMLEGVATK